MTLTLRYLYIDCVNCLTCFKNILEIRISDLLLHHGDNTHFPCHEHAIKRIIRLHVWML